MRKRSGYLVNQMAQEFEFRVQLTQPQGAGHPLLEAKAATQRIVYWTQGHTFLTYRIYQLILEWSEAERQGPEAAHSTHQPDPLRCPERLWVDSFIESRILQRCTDPEIIRHLRNICQFMLQAPKNQELLALYQCVLQGDRPAIVGGNDLHRRLLQSGLAKPQDGYLVLGNRIYARIFDAKWVRRAERTIAAQLEAERAAAAQEALNLGYTGSREVIIPDIDPKPAFDEALLAASRHLASTIEPSQSLPAQIQDKLQGSSRVGRVVLTGTVCVVAGMVVAGTLLSLTQIWQGGDPVELPPTKARSTPSSTAP